MHYEKGLIILNASDLDLVAQCPFSVTLPDRFRRAGDCVRCNAFSEIAYYCFKRASKDTNSISDKRLKEKYERILYSEGVGDDARTTMARSDGLILTDIINISRQYQESIDNVEPDIQLNLGRFVIREKLDAILCIQGQYFVTKFVCSDHPDDGHFPLRYQAMVGSLWVRENYKVDASGVCFIQFRSNQEPIIRCVDITMTTEQLRDATQVQVNKLDPEQPINNEADFKKYKDQQLARLTRSFGNHCWDCQEPTCIRL